MEEVKYIEPIQNFFCIGVQKAGTTTLSEILAQHSEIFLPEIKETKFFLFEQEFQKGLEYYNTKYFEKYSGEKMVGEFDPDYMIDPAVPKRLFETYGQHLKFIVILRNPVDRAYSHYLMTRRKGLESLSFEQALVEEDGRKKDLKEQKIFAYKARSLYAAQIESYFAYFPPHNFLFLIFEEDIANNLESTVARIQEFFQIPVQDLQTDIHSNEAFEAKSEVVRDLVRRPNFAKRLMKWMIPGKESRKQIRSFLIRKNAQNVKTIKLDAELKKHLFQIYFKDDVAKTEKLINRKLNYN